MQRAATAAEITVAVVSFAWPWVILLLPLPLLIQQWQARRSSDNTLAIAVPPRLQQALDAVAASRQRQSFLHVCLPWISWSLLLLALAQPSIPGEAVVTPATGRAITLAIDLSGSMERKDFIIEGEQSDRLSVVKRVAGEFITRRRGDRIGLVLFGAEAFIASPLSFDLLAVTGNLQTSGIGMAGRSTAIGDALGLAVQTLRNDPATEKAIVLLSDGSNNSGSVEPESAAELAESLSIRVHTIALGSDRVKQGGFDTAPSADLDEATLQSIAAQSGGQFYRAKTFADLNDIYSDIDKLEGAEARSPPVILNRDLRNVIIVALLLTLLMYECVDRRLA